MHSSKNWIWHRLASRALRPQQRADPSYHPAVLLKIYIYGDLNRVQSSRRSERECRRNVELMWLTGRLTPDSKTIADFRRDSGKGIRAVCRRFVELCRDLKLFSQAKGTDAVGYNVQVAVDTKHHLIVAHEVTNVGTDRVQLTPMAKAAREAMAKPKLRAYADRGYFNGPQIKGFYDAGTAAFVPEPMTSNAKSDGRFDAQALDGFDALPDQETGQRRHRNESARARI